MQNFNSSNITYSDIKYRLPQNGVLVLLILQNDQKYKYSLKQFSLFSLMIILLSALELLLIRIMSLIAHTILKTTL